MVASISDWLGFFYLLTSPFFLLLSVFWVWMLVDAIIKREWVWAIVIFFAHTVGAAIYYFLVYRGAPSATRGFELPGAHDRRRIKQLQAQIHHLDKAHHHSQLGDVYFQQGKLALAEASYRAAMERDPQDQDTRSHFGQCLLRQKRPAEARPLLEGVVAENPRHDYNYTRMALAETLTALGETDAAINVWKQVTAENSYPRAKVQLAELYLAKNEADLARAEVYDLLADEAHAPTFQRRRDRVWLSRGKKLLRKL